VLGQAAVLSEGDGIRLAPEVIDCDTARLEALIREGSRSSLAQAVELYKDRLMADMAIGEETWTDWANGERQRLEEMALDALIRFGEIELAEGRGDKAIETAQRALAINQLREDAHRLILWALAAAGRNAEALKHYQSLVALLKRELNAEPDAATALLAAELRGARSSGRSPAARETTVPLVVPDDEAAAPAASHAGGAERRQLTILVCNLVRSIPHPGRGDPEDMHDLVAAFHREVSEIVARSGGIVAQYLSDGVLVYFGYPAAHEHDAERAVRAGFDILGMVDKLKVAFGAARQASVGIATGLVVIGEQGEANRRLVAVGETANLAARLQAMAAPGEVVIAGSTRRLVGRMFDCRALGSDMVKGLPQAWQVRGEIAGVSRFEARRAGPLSPLVGRQEEIDLLLRRWDKAKLGEGRVVLLSGEPGIGKSRIAETLLVRLEGEPHGRLRYFCSPHHAHSPLYPFVAQLERAAGFEPGDSDGDKLDRLDTVLGPTAKNALQDVPLIAELLGIPADSRYPALAVSPQQKREMTLVALLDQLHGVVARNPVLIVFEDAHWIDPTSLDLLDRTIARVASLPVLLVVTLRPEFQQSWVGQPHVTMLPLSRLGRRDSASIIGGIARDKALPDVVVEQILSHTDGVPLFIEELTSMLLESGLLRETLDSYVLDGPLPSLAVPTTLQASLVARLDRLGPAKDVAQISAAIGREFSHELIAAVSGLGRVELDAALERLTASGLISRRGMPPDASYSFRHMLVRDAAYVTMLRGRQRQLHANIARALLERFPAQAERQPEVVAQHLTDAGLADEAIDNWVRAGRLARARWANREAVIFFERALAMLATLPETRATLERGFDIRFELRLVLFLLSKFRRALERLREAEILAERLDDDRRRGQVCAFMTSHHVLVGKLDDALASGTRALEIVERLGDSRLRIVTTAYLRQTHFFRGEYERVVTLATSGPAVLPAERASESFGLIAPTSLSDRGWLVLSLAELGRFAEAARPEAEAIELAVPTQEAFTVSWAHMTAGSVHLLRGDWAQALPKFEHAIAVLKAGNTALLLSNSIASSAWALAQLGEASEALNRLRKGEQLVERRVASGIVGLLAWRYRLLGRAAFVLGLLDDARRLGDRAIEFSPGQPGFAAHALHLLGDIAAHPDRFDAERGEAYYRQALALAEPRGMRPLVAHCRLGLGKLYRRTGKRDRAGEQLTAATAMYRKMDMGFWLEQANAETRQPQ